MLAIPDSGWAIAVLTCIGMVGAWFAGQKFKAGQDKAQVMTVTDTASQVLAHSARITKLEEASFRSEERLGSVSRDVSDVKKNVQDLSGEVRELIGEVRYGRTGRGGRES